MIKHFLRSRTIFIVLAAILLSVVAVRAATNIGDNISTNGTISAGNFLGTWQGLTTTTLPYLSNATSYLSPTGNFHGTWSGLTTTTLPYLSNSLTHGYIFAGNAANTAAATSTIYLKNNNIGIGTTSPSQLLSVGRSNNFTIDNSGNGYFSGNVGIGTTIPDSALQVAGLFDVNDSLRNVSIGTKNMTYNSTDGGYPNGNGNTSVGVYSMYQNTYGSFNTSFGSQSMQSNTSGVDNTAVGKNALISNTTAGANTVIGFNAGVSITGGDNYVSSHNTCVGVECLVYTTSGQYNSCVGAHCLHENTIANYNTADGADGLFWTTTGGNNSSLGYQAGYNNISGANNTFIGFSSGYSTRQSTSSSNSLALGANSYFTTDNEYVYGTSTVQYHVFPGGKVGIGTSTPTSILDVAAQTGTSTITIGQMGKTAACFKMVDVSKSSYSYCTFSGGVMTCSTNDCSN